MGFYNHPNEHKLRKPKKGFQGSKELQVQHLYEYKYIDYSRSKIDLDERTILKSEKKQNWKVWKKMIIVFAISLPIIIAVNQFVFQYLSAIEKKNQAIINKIPLSFYKKIEYGFKAYSNQEYQKAIFYYQSAKRDNKMYLNGDLGLLIVYHEMCENGNIYGCQLFEELLLSDKIQTRFRGKTKKEIIVELAFRKKYLNEVHLGIPNQRKAFNHTLRKAYTALNDKDYTKAIEKFEHIEKHYEYYVNGTLGLLSIYEEWCQKDINDGCQLLTSKLSSKNARQFFRGKNEKEKLKIIRDWKEKKLKLHLKEVTNYDFYTSGY